MVYSASSGLDLTRYRAYDPSLRMWLSRDPVGMMSGLALIQAGLAMPVALGGSGARWVGLNLAINRYPYVGNDPLNWVDPNGDISQEARSCIAGICFAITRLFPAPHCYELPEEPREPIPIIQPAPANPKPPNE